MKPKRVLRRALMQLGVRVPDKLLDNDMRSMRRMAQIYTKSDVVIDLGSHVGKSAIEFSHCVKEVYAYEPNPINFAELSRRTRRYSNIKIFQQAISHENGRTTLYYEDAKPGRFYEGATIVSGKSNVSYTRHFDVETVSIVDLLTKIDSGSVIIKMDIEGAEYIVLDALLNTGLLEKVRKIYVECHLDRIPELAEPKRRVLEKAAALGVLGKLDFTWP